jgi:S-DNA-T family DNA segregation ATPase FtsK/SpoIIIE
MPALALPRRPESTPPYAPPVVAALAPVAVSVAIFAVTRSPFALLFAALGPVVAIASWLDSRWQRRRTRRRELARFDAEFVAAEAAIAAAHERERQALDRRHPGAFASLRAAADPEHWRDALGAAVPVVLGRGEVASMSAPFEEPPRLSGDDDVEARLATLVARAGVVADAPVTVDARLGIGLVGPAGAVEPALRGILIQLLSRLDPRRAELLLPEGSRWDWLRAAPHVRQGTAPWPRFADRAGGAELTVATGEVGEALPRECRVVVGVRGGAGILRKHPDLAPGAALRLELVAEGEAGRHIEALAAVAARAGVVGAATLPAAVPLGALPPAAVAGHSLAVPVGADGDGPVVLDLVADGPHAVIGGTTGTGKSELLTSWVVALARDHPPSVVTLLLIDFKGGASFAAVRSLPHVVGVVTDLDAAAARRAIASLRAELRHRERLLAEAGERALEDLPPGALVPRLVLVVDEFAAVLAEFPDLHDLFTDVAARGRSLGVHLILCTQRPSGVVREALLANCPLRLSLRVTNRPDSVAVLGVPDAAELPRSPQGRALVSTGDGIVRLFQVALADADIVALVEADAAPPPRRPWLEPLPRVLPLSALPAHAHGIALGLLDVPEEQDQPRAVLRGNTLVLGGRGSGRSTLLDTLESQAPGDVARTGPHLEVAWDVLTALAEGRRSAPLVLVDDVDALLARCGDEHRAALAEALARVLRDLPATTVVLTAQRLAGAVLGFAPLCPHRVLLRLADRQEHHAAGGAVGEWESGLPPGAGWYDGRRLQVALAAPRPRAERPPDAPLSLPLAVVSRRARALLGELSDVLPVHALDEGGAASPYAVTVGDPDAWHAAPREFAAARARGGVLFDRCAVADVRLLARIRELPPLLDPASGRGWLLGADGTLSRGRLPTRSVVALAPDPVTLTEQNVRFPGDHPLIS